MSNKIYCDVKNLLFYSNIRYIANENIRWNFIIRKSLISFLKNRNRTITKRDHVIYVCDDLNIICTNFTFIQLWDSDKTTCFLRNGPAEADLCAADNIESTMRGNIMQIHLQCIITN